MLLGGTSDMAAVLQEDGLQSVSQVMIAGCVLTIVCFAPLLMHTAASIPFLSRDTGGPSAQLSIPAAVPGGPQNLNSSELHFVDLKSIEEGRYVTRSKHTKAGKYTAYSNPYADDATEPGTIQPTLMPQVRHACHPDNEDRPLCNAAVHSPRSCLYPYGPIPLAPSHATARSLAAAGPYQSDRRCTNLVLSADWIPTTPTRPAAFAPSRNTCSPQRA
jgi:hypothetical protein